jgi:hypothetical protein
LYLSLIVENIVTPDCRRSASYFELQNCNQPSATYNHIILIFVS